MNRIDPDFRNFLIGVVLILGIHVCFGAWMIHKVNNPEGPSSNAASR